MMETAKDLNMEMDEMQLVVSALRGVRTPLSLPMETGKI